MLTSSRCPFDLFPPGNQGDHNNNQEKKRTLITSQYLKRGRGTVAIAMSHQQRQLRRRQTFVGDTMHHMYLSNVGPTIHAVMEFDEQLSLPALRTLCSEKLLLYPRFASRISEGGHHWEPVTVDIAKHVTEQPLPAVGGNGSVDESHPRRAVEAHVGRVLLEHFDPTGPCWTATILRCDTATHGKEHGAKSFVVWRIAHSIGDGITLASLLMSLATPLPAPTGEKRQELGIVTAGGGAGIGVKNQQSAILLITKVGFCC